MNRNLTAVACTIAALGLVAAFDIIPGAGVSAGVILLATGGVLFLGQLIRENSSWLWPEANLSRSAPSRARTAASLPRRS